MDAGNLLKPALASGTLRCIGSTTFSDVKQSFDKDRALSRRFQKIEVLEPTEAETVDILKGLRIVVRVASRREVHGRGARGRRVALEPAPEGSAPARQGDRRDRRGWGDGEARARRLRRVTAPLLQVTVADIEHVVAKIARVPVQAVSSDDKVALKNLDLELKSVIFGQDPAIDEVTSAIKLSRSGFARPTSRWGAFCSPARPASARRSWRVNWRACSRWSSFASTCPSTWRSTPCRA